jgi:hypothetical protein
MATEPVNNVSKEASSDDGSTQETVDVDRKSAASTDTDTSPDTSTAWMPFGKGQTKDFERLVIPKSDPRVCVWSGG